MNCTCSKTQLKTTPENITSLDPSQIFVFGSNTAGVHGKGAARVAQRLFGAVKGMSEGPTGRCYAIPTRVYSGPDGQHWKVRFSPVPIGDIHRSIIRFLDYAQKHPDLEFLVTKIGCGFAGYDFEDMADIFSREEVPSNVVLPKEFYD